MRKLALILFVTFISCQSNKKSGFEKKLIYEIQKTDIAAVVMGKINKSGKMEFYSHGPSRWGRNDTIDQNSIFKIASMTKAIASVAALQLVEQGKITLDEPLDSLMPEMSKIPILNEDNEIVIPKKSITLRHLLTHTAGFGYGFSSPQLSVWDSLKIEINWKNTYEPRFFESGTSFMYGTNIDWVGRLIEKVSKMNLEDYLRINITGPLDMKSTSFIESRENENRVAAFSHRDTKLGILIKDSYSRENPTNQEGVNLNIKKNKNEFNAGGALSSSPEDYGKFLICMLNKGEYNGKRILKEETFDLMNSPQLKDFKIIARHSPVENVDSKPRGDKDHFWDNNDNWTLAWAYEESSSIRPKGTAYWAGFFNTYFTIDFKNDFALIYMTQMLPFNDMISYNLFTSFERLVYEDHFK